MEKNIKSITLHWKEELLDKEIFPIPYREFWEIWTRVLLVAGFPESMRPYAVRVGAGSRMNGTFGPFKPLPSLACATYSDAQH